MVGETETSPHRDDKRRTNPVPRDTEKSRRKETQRRVDSSSNVAAIVRSVWRGASHVKIT